MKACRSSSPTTRPICCALSRIRRRPGPISSSRKKRWRAYKGVRAISGNSCYRKIALTPLFLARRPRILGPRKGEQALDLVGMRAPVVREPNLHQAHGAGNEQAEEHNHDVDRMA